MTKQKFPQDFLPESVTNESPYERERKNNERLFKEQVRQIRPDLFLLMDVLDETGLNPVILWKTAYHLNNFILTNGWGEVKIRIQDYKVTFIYGVTDDKLDEPLVVKNKMPT